MRARTGTADVVPFDAGGVFYFDTMHFSTYGARATRRMYAPVFESVGRGPADGR